MRCALESFRLKVSFLYDSNTGSPATICMTACATKSAFRSAPIHAAGWAIATGRSFRVNEAKRVPLPVVPPPEGHTQGHASGGDHPRNVLSCSGCFTPGLHGVHLLWLDLFTLRIEPDFWRPACAGCRRSAARGKRGPRIPRRAGGSVPVLRRRSLGSKPLPEFAGRVRFSVGPSCTCRVEFPAVSHGAADAPDVIGPAFGVAAFPAGPGLILIRLSSGKNARLQLAPLTPAFPVSPDQ